MRHLIREFMRKKVTTGSRDDILRTKELVSSILEEERTFLKKLQ